MQAPVALPHLYSTSSCVSADATGGPCMGSSMHTGSCSASGSAVASAGAISLGAAAGEGLPPRPSRLRKKLRRGRSASRSHARANAQRRHGSCTQARSGASASGLGCPAAVAGRACRRGAHLRSLVLFSLLRCGALAPRRRTGTSSSLLSVAAAWRSTSSSRLRHGGSARGGWGCRTVSRRPHAWTRLGSSAGGCRLTKRPSDMHCASSGAPRVVGSVSGECGAGLGRGPQRAPAVPRAPACSQSSTSSRRRRSPSRPRPAASPAHRHGRNIGSSSHLPYKPRL
jgi:hypothetical protein